MNTWIISDTKPGHLNQSIGLAEALIELNPAHTYREVPYLTFVQCFLCLLGLFSTAWMKSINPNDIAIGAGRKTHATLALLKLKFKLTSIVIMRPSLPTFLFSWCIIPEHDGILETGNILNTNGAINRVKPSKQLIPNKGLILIGGPSKHYQWDNRRVIEQLQLTTNSPEIEWTLTTSRRTPSDFIEQLEAQHLPIQCVPFEKTDNEWLPNHLNKSGIVWVSPDSVSMIYEALTAGSQVFTFELPITKENRVNKGITKMINSKTLTLIKNNNNQSNIYNKQLYEAMRIAKKINLKPAP
jgi:mitochondrial fission protein ELM1